eukprot:96824-Amphidinium_carterae.1
MEKETLDHSAQELTLFSRSGYVFIAIFGTCCILPLEAATLVVANYFVSYGGAVMNYLAQYSFIYDLWSCACN